MNTDKRTNGSKRNSEFHRFFVDAMKDIYWAEKHLDPALLKMEKAATDPGLAAAFKKHNTESARQIQLVEQVFELLGVKPATKKCEAMAGLIKEAEEIIADTERDSFVRDAGLILAAQKVEHYEIATYGTLVALADFLPERGVKKLLSTYVDALPELVNPRTGRIHTSYNQAVTATGRLSSTNPNLQNIPIRDALGKPIRAAFVAADEDHLLLSADYSQIELRLMAHLSGDDALIEAFVEGRDIHAATAARLYRKNIDEVTDDERRRAKTANFGIIYGISAFGLSQRLDIPRKEAKEIIDGYFASYPDVKRYMDEVVEKAKERGYVETIFGRRRILSDIDSRNAVARSLAERNAINAPIQGSAADIMKIAMVEIRRRFLAEGIRSRMILQVHDEVVVDTLRSEVDAVRRIVTEAMQGAARLRVPLIAECGTGDNWLEAH